MALTEQGEVLETREGGTPRMQPVSFGRCFGWLHSTASGSGDIGAILCTGIGRDANNAHRAWRQMADALAETGVPALRFDYPGTGDSLEADCLETWSAWRESISEACAWLRATTGVRRLALVGLRLGASLAALEASSRTDVVALALIEPVLRGKSFVTQLRVEARLRRIGAEIADEIEINELRLGQETAALISRFDLRTVTPGRAGHAAVFSNAASPLLTEWADRWREQGVAVTCDDLSGLEPMLRPSHLPGEDIDASGLISWMRRLPAAERECHREVAVLRQPCLRPSGCVETPIRFGTNDQLFGMLCQSTERGDDRAVIIGNTGGDPHHGFARFSVELARRLARDAGLASFRIDFAGLGDSPGRSADHDVTNHLFTVDRIGDIGAALDALQQLGLRRFALNGLCSGAYHALQAALADERVDELLVVNLPFFSIRLDRPGPDSNTRRSLSALSRRQVRTLLLFSEDDAGLKWLEPHFGPRADYVRQSEAAIEIVPGLDHDLTGSAMRRLVADRMVAFFGPSNASGGSVAAE